MNNLQIKQTCQGCCAPNCPSGIRRCTCLNPNNCPFFRYFEKERGLASSIRGLLPPSIETTRIPSFNSTIATYVPGWAKDDESSESGSERESWRKIMRLYNYAVEPSRVGGIYRSSTGFGVQTGVCIHRVEVGLVSPLVYFHLCWRLRHNCCHSTHESWIWRNRSPSSHVCLPR